MLGELLKKGRGCEGSGCIWEGVERGGVEMGSGERMKRDKVILKTTNLHNIT